MEIPDQYLQSLLIACELRIEDLSQDFGSGGELVSKQITDLHQVAIILRKHLELI